MLILNAGVPRSGTVLVNAMIRALLKQKGVPILQANPHGRELAQVGHRAIRSGDHRVKVVLVHSHSWDFDAERVLAGDENVVAFGNYRDPRDICVSLMKLHDHSLENAISNVSGYFQQYEAMVRALNAMVIPYELLINAKEAFAFQIARRIGIWPTFAQIAEVVEATSVERHRKVMQDVKAGTLPDIAERQNQQRVLREDRRTLINDRHIQSGASGRWRGELPGDQHETVNAAFAPLLERYGYEL